VLGRRVLPDGADAFEIAEMFQTPVFVMMDLDLGMTTDVHAFSTRRPPINRGKLLTRRS